MESLKPIIKKEAISKNLQPIKIEIFDSADSFKEKCRIEMLTNPYDVTTMVNQGSFRLYENKPFYSGGFTRCTGIILESERALGFLHMDPGEQWLKDLRKIEKFYAGEQAKVDVSIKQEINFDDHSKNFYGWEVAYDPEQSNLIVHGTPEDIHTLWIYDMGKMKYSDELHNQSKSFFESRDYMPRGFRECEQYFLDQNYIINDTHFDSWGRDPEKTVKEQLYLSEGNKVFIWTPKTGLIEKPLDLNQTIGDLVFSDWDPYNTLIFTTSDYDGDNSNFKHKGWARGYKLDSQDLSSYYLLNDVLTQDEIKKKYMESRDQKSQRSIKS